MCFSRDPGAGSISESIKGTHNDTATVFYHRDGVPVCLPTPVSSRPSAYVQADVTSDDCLHLE